MFWKLTALVACAILAPTQSVRLAKSGNWIYMDREPNIGRTWPFDSRALAPVIALRHHLGELQWSSAHGKPGSPLLARFEIVDAYSDMHPMVFTPQVPSEIKDGFVMLAVLYWVDVSGEDTIPRMTSRVVHKPLGEVGHGTLQEGANITSLRIQIVQFVVSPRNCKTIKNGNVTSYLLGAEGWNVEPKPWVVKEFRTRLGKSQRSLPFYDISYLIVNKERTE
jgi:hypothetical protein